jgi:hypothetical protein
MNPKELTARALPLAQTLRELERYAPAAERFGLTLSAEQRERLARCRTEALQKTGRVEFGEGVLGKLILAFCDSPNLVSSEYEETLAELQELFYSFKNECRDQVTDDELILAMRLFYDRFGGSLDALAGTDRSRMYRAALTGCLPPEETGGGEEDEADE